MFHLKAGIKLIRDELSVIRVKLAVADHLPTDVNIATIKNIIVDRAALISITRKRRIDESVTFE